MRSDGVATILVRRGMPNTLAASRVLPGSFLILYRMKYVVTKCHASRDVSPHLMWEWPIDPSDCPSDTVLPFVASRRRRHHAECRIRARSRSRTECRLTCRSLLRANRPRLITQRRGLSRPSPRDDACEEQIMTNWPIIVSTHLAAEPPIAAGTTSHRRPC